MHIILYVCETEKRVTLGRFFNFEIIVSSVRVRNELSKNIILCTNHTSKRFK